jgi:hypothetical protein
MFLAAVIILSIFWLSVSLDKWLHEREKKRKSINEAWVNELIDKALKNEKCT